MKNLCLYFDNYDIKSLCSFIFENHYDIFYHFYNDDEEKYNGYCCIKDIDDCSANKTLYIFGKEGVFTPSSDWRGWRSAQDFICITRCGPITPCDPSVANEIQPGSVGVHAKVESPLYLFGKEMHKFIKKNFTLSVRKGCYIGPHILDEWYKGKISLAEGEYDFPRPNQRHNQGTVL